MLAFWSRKSGDNARKIGARILKGRWKDYAVYTLTLEERKTCPTSCHHWRSCFGNKMHLADRVAAGPDLLWRLEREIALLEIRHPGGFAVRYKTGALYVRFKEKPWMKVLLSKTAVSG